MNKEHTFVETVFEKDGFRIDLLIARSGRFSTAGEEFGWREASSLIRVFVPDDSEPEIVFDVVRVKEVRSFWGSRTVEESLGRFKSLLKAKKFLEKIN